MIVLVVLVTLVAWLYWLHGYTGHTGCMVVLVAWLYWSHWLHGYTGHWLRGCTGCMVVLVTLVAWLTMQPVWPVQPVQPCNQCDLYNCNYKLAYITISADMAHFMVLTWRSNLLFAIIITYLISFWIPWAKKHRINHFYKVSMSIIGWDIWKLLFYGGHFENPHMSISANVNIGFQIPDVISFSKI